MEDPGVKTGKLEISVLDDLLAKYTITDPRVMVGPGIGEDAAVIASAGDSEDCWVVTSDPITFTTEDIGYYGVVVNLNDIATRGAIPKWFLATLLFPEACTPDLIENVFKQIHRACRKFQISFIGGHTEITPGIGKTILSGHMVGEVKKEKLVTTGGAREGDLLLIVKGLCIEGTSIIAREKGDELLARGIDSTLIERARGFIFNPGIDVLQAARLACESATVHAMHDPTEGGLINGIAEMALASGKEFEVDLSKTPIYEESRTLCRELGLDPLGVIASGALLLAVSPSDLSRLQKAFTESSIPLQLLGQVKKGIPRVLNVTGTRTEEVQPLARDEILKIYD
jgi:hydrogenase expression/formation protein HypE